MMVILDALFAFVLFQLFGVNALYILGITCFVTVVRTSVRFNHLMSILEFIINNVVTFETTEGEEDENGNL